MEGRAADGRDPSGTASAFCREVLAGRAPSRLPDGAAERAEILGLLRRHRLLGLWTVERRGPDPGPSDADVRGPVVQQAFHAGLVLEAADRAMAALRAGGLEVLSFKGVGLVRCGVYADPAARALGDADLLVRGGPAGQAVRILEAAGFEPWVPWDPGREAWLPAFSLSDATAPEGVEVTVDLHWRIPYGSYRSGAEGDGAELWADADRERGSLSPEAHALLLAEHFVRHLRVVPHLIGLADLVRLLPHVRDPARLRALAGTRRSTRPMRAVLGCVRDELGVDLDPDLARAVEVPARRSRREVRALRLGALLQPAGGRREGRIEGLVGQALLQGSPGDFLRELARVVYPPAEWLARRAGPETGGALRRRFGYWRDLIRWALGRRGSPLSPNQEFEDPAGRS